MTKQQALPFLAMQAWRAVYKLCLKMILLLGVLMHAHLWHVVCACTQQCAPCACKQRCAPYA